jgi:penicillin-binding protein 1A
MKFKLLEIKNRKRFNIWFFGIISLPFITLALTLTYLTFFGSIPSFEELENPKSKVATQIISEDGVLLGTFHVENRSHVSYDELSSNLILALLATEDVRFSSHSGIDFRSLARVLVKTIIGGRSESGGGSTITQQLAKNLFPRDSTITRSISSVPKITIAKLKEWITAVKLERNYTKEEIIAMYLNTVSFGSNAFGIRAAAATFFAKLPSQLNTEEAALLVGVINAPTRYSPVRNPERAVSRRNHVLSQMGKYGFIPQESRDSLFALPITLSFMQQDHHAGLAPYFREMLRRTMLTQEPRRENYRSRPRDYEPDKKEWEENPLVGWIRKNPKPDGTLYDIDRDGLKIYTTINSKMQLYAEQAVTRHLRTELQPAFSADVRARRSPPFDNELTPEQVNNIMEQAKRWSDRYRSMKRAGASDEEINKSFNTRTKMTIFAWNDRGQKDTVMTPIDSIRYYKSILRAAFMAMDVQTGQVRAYVGGPNYRHFKYDNASQGRRQVGSTIKPFLYTLAMQEGFTPCDKVLNVSQTFIVNDTTWTPATTDRPEWIGKHVTLKWGLTRSSNNISAFLMKQLGPAAMVTMCRRLGIKSFLDPVVSLCLGPADLYLTEMVAAYGTYANKGVHIEPLYVTRIEDKHGNLLATFTPQRRESISARTAYLMVNLLQGVVNEGTAHRLRRLYVQEGELAGKTGTTNNQSDGWFMGFVPKLVAGVWVGAEDRSVHFQTLAMGGGANTALPIWGLFMEKVLADPSLNINTTDRFEVPANFNINLNCTGGDEELEAEDDNRDDFF